MGRIAEALKKAEADRAEKRRLVRADASAGDAPVDRSAPIVDVPPALTAVAGDEAKAEPPRDAGTRLHDAARAARPRDERLVCLQQPDSAVAEQFRAVRTWLLRHNTAGEHRSLAVTSSLQREGRTVTVANLGLCLAEVRHLSVLVIDADLRGRALASLFNVPQYPGLADVLAGTATFEDTIHPTGVPNLSIIPAGNPPPDGPAELLSSRAAQIVLDEARERFHYVLIDTPPVQTASDVGLIGGMCTDVLMVVRAGRAPEPIVRQSLRWLQANNLPLIGCVLSAAAPSSARRRKAGGDAR